MRSAILLLVAVTYTGSDDEFETTTTATTIDPKFSFAVNSSMTVHPSTTKEQAEKLCKETAKKLGLVEENVQGCKLPSEDRFLEAGGKKLEMTFGVESEEMATSASGQMFDAIQSAAKTVGIPEPTGLYTTSVKNQAANANDTNIETTPAPAQASITSTPAPTAEELAKRMKEIALRFFDSADKNDDGKMTVEECKAFAQKMSESLTAEQMGLSPLGTEDDCQEMNRDEYIKALDEGAKEMEQYDETMLAGFKVVADEMQKIVDEILDSGESATSGDASATSDDASTTVSDTKDTDVKEDKSDDGTSEDKSNDATLENSNDDSTKDSNDSDVSGTTEETQSDNADETSASNDSNPETTEETQSDTADTTNTSSDSKSETTEETQPDNADETSASSDSNSETTEETQSDTADTTNTSSNSNSETTEETQSDTTEANTIENSGDDTNAVENTTANNTDETTNDDTNAVENADDTNTEEVENRRK